jgi:hypothetical protein
MLSPPDVRVPLYRRLRKLLIPERMVKLQDFLRLS